MSVLLPIDRTAYRPRVQDVLPYRDACRQADRDAYQKAKKFSRKFWFQHPPPKISNRFPFRLASVKSPHYPKILYIWQKKDMAKARKDYPKPRSKRSIRRLAEMVKMNDEKIAKFVEEYATRDS